MTTSPLPDPSTTFGARVRDRLAEETVIWLTTVGADGTPQPNPVWFHWDGEDSILIYTRADAHRLAHLARNPRVSLNFNTIGGSQVVVLAGDAEVPAGHPPATEGSAFAAKYTERIAQMFGDAAGFAEKYPVAVRVRITRVRGF